MIITCGIIFYCKEKFKRKPVIGNMPEVKLGRI